MHPGISVWWSDLFLSDGSKDADCPNFLGLRWNFCGLFSSFPEWTVNFTCRYGSFFSFPEWVVNLTLTFRSFFPFSWKNRKFYSDFTVSRSLFRMDRKFRLNFPRLYGPYFRFPEKTVNSSPTLPPFFLFFRMDRKFPTFTVPSHLFPKKQLRIVAPN